MKAWNTVEEYWIIFFKLAFQLLNADSLLVHRNTYYIKLMLPEYLESKVITRLLKWKLLTYYGIENKYFTNLIYFEFCNFLDIITFYDPAFLIL